jgi:transcriptional regulator with XRE-family HTH domain
MTETIHPFPTICIHSVGFDSFRSSTEVSSRNDRKPTDTGWHRNVDGADTPTDDYEALARFLTRARSETRLSQKRLAEAIGIGENTYASLERGNGRKSHPGTFRLIEAYYEWPAGTLDDVLSGKVDPEAQFADKQLEKLQADISRIESRQDALDKKLDSIIDAVRSLSDKFPQQG